MSYFYNQEHVETPKLHARGTRVPPVPAKCPMTRAEILDAQVEKMNKYFVEPDAPIVKRGGIHCPPKRDANIFGGPINFPKPSPRIRPGISEDDMKKLWQEDDRKARAQDQVGSGATMVDKMYQCDYPIPHKQDPPPPAKARIDRPDDAPWDLRGVGELKPKNSGRRCRPVEEFEIPKLMLKPRTDGKKIVAPANTFSHEHEIVDVHRRLSDGRVMGCKHFGPSGNEPRECHNHDGKV